MQGVGTIFVVNELLKQRKILILGSTHLKLRQEYSTTSVMALAASLSLRVGRNRALQGGRGSSVSGHTSSGAGSM